MAESKIPGLLAMLERGMDSALLRYSLGAEYLADGNPETAQQHLAIAVEQDAGYSAAWKLLGRSLLALERWQEAMEVFDKGISVAEARGDVQAAKEMKVFRRRAERALSGTGNAQ